MANLSQSSRREQVLNKLKETHDWVDGPELANEHVGGSEGLKRLRELRVEGYRIEMRKHPDPGRDIWQYRLADGGAGLVLPRGASPDRRGHGVGGDAVVGDGGRQHPIPIGVSPEPLPLQADRVPTLKYEEMPKKLAFGEAIPCPKCEGKKTMVNYNKQRVACTRCNGFGIVPVP